MGTVIYVIVTSATIVALWRILPRAGLSEFWALAALVPFTVPIILLVLAFRPWPGDQGFMGRR